MGKNWRWFWKILRQQEKKKIWIMPRVPEPGSHKYICSSPVSGKRSKLGPKAWEVSFSVSPPTMFQCESHAVGLCTACSWYSFPLLKVTNYKMEHFQMLHLKIIKSKRGQVGLFLTLKKFPRFWNDILYSIYSTLCKLKNTDKISHNLRLCSCIL